VCSVIASFAGYRVEHQNPTRHRAGQRIIRWAFGNRADIVVLPAGFARAHSERPDDLLCAVEPLLVTAYQYDIRLAVGVDACGPDGEDRVAEDRLVWRGMLPYFAVVSSTTRAPPQVFRQRSTTNTNWQIAPEGVNTDVRLTNVGGNSVAIVLSGEVFSVPVRRGLEAARPSVAVVLAHETSLGRRQWDGLARLGKLGIPALRAAHALGRASNVLVRGSEKAGPVVAPIHLQDGEFSTFAHIFEV
jgi:hypothetical protein